MRERQPLVTGWRGRPGNQSRILDWTASVDGDHRPGQAAGGSPGGRPARIRPNADGTPAAAESRHGESTDTPSALFSLSVTEGSGEPRPRIGRRPRDGNAHVAADVPEDCELDWRLKDGTDPSTGRPEHDAEIRAQLALPDEGLDIAIDGAGQFRQPVEEAATTVPPGDDGDAPSTAGAGYAGTTECRARPPVQRPRRTSRRTDHAGRRAGAWQASR